MKEIKIYFLFWERAARIATTTNATKVMGAKKVMNKVTTGNAELFDACNMTKVMYRT
jgi:hypothetical protein